MLLKPIKDIDKEVRLPKELEFRSEAVWNRIQTNKKESPSKAVFFWFGAASVAILLGLFLFGDERETLIDDSHLVTGRSKKEVIFDLKIEKPKVLISEESPVQLGDTLMPYLKKFVVKAEVTSQEKAKSLVETVDLKNEISVIIEPEVKEEKPKELSPAALYLQKGLAKLNKDKSVDQVVFVEKFNLLNELNVGRVQASTSTLPNSVFQSIKKESNERN